jgi:hypothetical protein
LLALGASVAVATEPEVVVSSTFSSFLSATAFLNVSFLLPSLSASRKSGLAPSSSTLH